MRKRLQAARPNPAMMVAIIALIAALAGTAVAGGGFVTKKQFKNQALRGPLHYVRAELNIPTTDARGLDVIAVCPPGFMVVGGGISLSSKRNMQVVDSHPYTINEGWEGTVINVDTTSHTAQATAICARSSDYEFNL